MLLMESSPTLTSNLEDSSAGASKTAFRRPWNLSLSKPRLETVAGYPILTLHWTREASDGDLHHFFSYKFADPFSATATAPVYGRLFAHLALDELPDAAVPEVLDFLANAWIFHQPSAPEIEQPAKTRKGKVTRRYERPTYMIEE